MNLKRKLKSIVMLSAMCFSALTGYIKVAAITPFELLNELADIYKISNFTHDKISKGRKGTFSRDERRRLYDLSKIAIKLGIDDVVDEYGLSIRECAETWECEYFLENIRENESKMKKTGDEDEPLMPTAVKPPLSLVPHIGRNGNIILRSKCVKLFELQEACGLIFDKDERATNVRNIVPHLTEEQTTKLDAIISKVKSKEKINAIYFQGNTLLHYAAMYNCPYLAMRLLDAGADINIKNRRGNTPLHVAAYYANAATLKLLVQHGARTDIKNKIGNIPLMPCMCKFPNIDICKLLLPPCYIDDNYANEKGETPLGLAKKYKRPEIVLRYLSHKDEKNRHTKKPEDANADTETETETDTDTETDTETSKEKSDDTSYEPPKKRAKTNK